MAIVSNIHAPTPPFAGRRWPSRTYPGQLAQTGQVRADLAADLYRLAGLPDETSENLVLCASEMFANACDHSRSGQDTEGRVVRTLHMPTAHTLQVAIVDDGQRTDTAEFQAPHTPQHTIEEWEQAERGRGLLLIGRLADRWGTRSVVDFPFCQGLGTVTWAEFTLPERTTTGEANR
ncbi:ATP-binding protein [Nocardiopsis metallicus]|uniref:Anti-sigma regulatory factor (Ser/Thr protein kinase) n=1 Tax=Nocardiopsis metallicus TaxID=179819 RepID=A0A840WN47_9ACTN|nr:ATP-binding protein [Nocardiopsis metallicus]MBB5493186.1 anti-sigma regulatory factor (Ser/Thr protein kinase) [Nocardiopsis metallicus]